MNAYSGWETARFGEIATVKHGWPFKSENFVAEVFHLPIVVAIGNFEYSGGFRFGNSSVKRYDGEYPEEYRLQPDDLLLVMTCQTEGGEILGVPALVPDDKEEYLHNQRIGLVKIADPERIDKRFLYHLARTADFNRQLFVTASGSKILHTSPSRIEATTLQLPRLSEQRAIAEVLSALDDKIAANARLTATAHELASTLFRQAVASAEYSGKTFGDLTTVSGGGTPSTKEAGFWDGSVPWATPTDITGLAGPYLEDTNRRITPAGLAACSSSLYPVGTILMTSRATIGAFALAQVPTSVNQGFITVQPTDESMRYWFYHEMRDRVDEFIAMANGATFLELSRGNFKKFEVRLADQSVMSAFCQRAESLHDAARHALGENRALTATRDALLPQLMSGKLRVKDAEKGVAAAV